MLSHRNGFFSSLCSQGGWLHSKVKEDRQPEDTGCLLEEIVKIRTSLYC